MAKNILDAVKMVKENGGVPQKLIQKESWKIISGLVATNIVLWMMVCFDILKKSAIVALGI